jgi:creatinine amidohydrolase
MPVRRWRELSTSDFDQLPKEEYVIVLPVGSMEQHGPHLPVSTDSLCVEAVVDDVVEQLDSVQCLFLPTLWCSKSNEHLAFPGTVFLSRETFSQVLLDIGASVARAGFRKLVLINAHGGNSGLLGAMIRDIRQDTGIVTFLIDFARLYGDNLPGALPTGKFDIHAGHFETSVLLASYPALMEGREFGGLGSDRERGRVAASFADFDYLRPEGGPVTTAWLTTDYTEDGVIGDPTAANAADGRRYVQILVDTVCAMLREIAAFEYRV